MVGDRASRPDQHTGKCPRYGRGSGRVNAGDFADPAAGKETNFVIPLFDGKVVLLNLERVDFYFGDKTGLL